MIQGRIEEKKIAQGFEQMFPRRRLYRITIMNTGMEVISTAICATHEVSKATVKMSGQPYREGRCRRI